MPIYVGYCDGVEVAGLVDAGNLLLSDNDDGCTVKADVTLGV